MPPCQRHLQLHGCERPGHQGYLFKPQEFRKPLAVEVSGDGLPASLVSSEEQPKLAQLSSLQVTAFVMSSVTQTASPLRTRMSGPVLKGPASGLEIVLLI